MIGVKKNINNSSKDVKGLNIFIIRFGRNNYELIKN